jgi:four helix bundle protein
MHSPGFVIRKNLNRGLRKLNVWNDAIELYDLVSKVMLRMPYELKKVGSNAIDAAQSISRNIAEGHCRRSIKEYLQFSYYALGSCGELYSCMYSFYISYQITEAEYDAIDKLHYKTENELIQLIKSLERKLKDKDWNSSLLF